MKATFEENLQDLKEYLKKIEYLNSAVSVLGWDMRVNIPEKGVPYRAEVMGYLAGESYKLQTSDLVKEYIDYFAAQGELDFLTDRMIKTVKKEYEKTKKVPEVRFMEYVSLTNLSESIWEKAKEESDYGFFKPYLDQVIAFNKEFIAYWGVKGCQYDTLLDFYEPDTTVDDLDRVFGEVRDAIVALLKRINESGKAPDASFLQGTFSVESQKQLIQEITAKIGYDYQAGRLDESAHPFTTGFFKDDVRITTNYVEHEFINALLGGIHEAGHGIYEQNIPAELQGTALRSASSMGIHESQSRFYENILGRSKEFWKYFYPTLVKTYPQFADISVDEFYKAINKAEPSLVRTEADELTYSLHIIIRYEIEKMFINGEVSVDDLPRIWNEKYREYLGIEPANDAEGILQDVHWSGGLIGYFPSYALGNLYNAQLLHQLKKEIPDYAQVVENGEFGIIKDWLVEKIHKHGAVYMPAELIKMATGEELNAKYFIEYINDKYSEVYGL